MACALEATDFARGGAFVQHAGLASDILPEHAQHASILIVAG